MLIRVKLGANKYKLHILFTFVVTLVVGCLFPPIDINFIEILLYLGRLAIVAIITFFAFDGIIRHLQTSKRLNKDLCIEDRSICLIRPDKNLCVVVKNKCLKRPNKDLHIIKNSNDIALYNNDINRRYRMAIAELFSPFIYGKQPEKAYTKTLNNILKKYNKKGKRTFYTVTNAVMFKYILDYFYIADSISKLEPSQRNEILHELNLDTEASTSDLHNKIVELWSTNSHRVKELLSLPADNYTKIEEHAKKPSKNPVPICIRDSINVLRAELQNKDVFYNYSSIANFRVNSTLINIHTSGLTEQKACISESLIYINLKESDPEIVDHLLHDEKRRHHKFRIKITLTKSV